MYKEIVCELQGNDDVFESYIDYYFTTNPMKSYVLSFKGEKEKTEFFAKKKFSNYYKVKIFGCR